MLQHLHRRRTHPTSPLHMGKVCHRPRQWPRRLPNQTAAATRATTMHPRSPRGSQSRSREADVDPFLLGGSRRGSPVGEGVQHFHSSHSIDVRRGCANHNAGTATRCYPALAGARHVVSVSHGSAYTADNRPLRTRDRKARTRAAPILHTFDNS